MVGIGDIAGARDDAPLRAAQGTGEGVEPLRPAGRKY